MAPSREVFLNPSSLLSFCRAHLDAMLEGLRQAVEIESPTHCRPQIDRLARFMAAELRRRHGRVRLLRHPAAGAAVVGEFWGRQSSRSRPQKPLLLLGHLDTVWEVGTLARMPFRVRGGKAYGPGILDMKSGIIIGLWAIHTLRSLGLSPASSVRIFLNSDEEASSAAFRRQLLQEARRARAVLVLEPAAAGGALKTSRKGVGEFRLTVHGRAAHAGINPAAGVSAISELARQILRIESWARPDRGLTLNVGVVEGGTRSNVVAERASARIDVRISRPADQVWIERRMRGLQPIHPEARLEIDGGIHRPPLEHRRAAGLFARAKELARPLGMELEEASTGGGSDGNLAAALGIPTLDGLGGVGDGAHARDEHIVIRELPRRAALLAALLAGL